MQSSDSFHLSLLLAPSLPMLGSAEMAHEASPLFSGLNTSQWKLNKSSPNSEPRSFKVIERKSSVENSHFLEKRSAISEMQRQLNQLEEDLMMEKEEKSRALEELKQIKKKSIAEKGATESQTELEPLEKEVERARQSERRMLESLVSQTKLLEENKMSLDEARLELKSFKENNSGLDISKVIGNWGSRNLGKYLPLEKYLPLPLNGSSSTVHAEEDKVLRNELRSAIEAEEYSKKAMDDLTVTLKEVMTEANLSKERLSVSQSELERVKAEAESLKSLLKRMEEKFEAAAEESEKLILEIDESTATWNAKESGFIDCIRMSEEELMKAKEDNDKLFESQRVIREENAKLRDILRQAVSEASLVKESLEIARRENSQLKDLLCEKETKLQVIKQEYESLKVSEAAATDSVKELKSLLAATSELDSTKTVLTLASESFRQSDSSNFTSSLGGGAFRLPETKVDDNKLIQRAPKFSSERWSGGNSRIRGVHRHSVGEPDKFTDPTTSNKVNSTKQNDRMFASLSNISEMRATQLIVIGDTERYSPEVFDHIDCIHLDDHSEKRKKKPIFRRFGDMLKRSVQKY